MSRFQYVFIGAILICCIVDAAVVRYETQLLNGLMTKEVDFIVCSCANNTKSSAALSRSLTREIIAGGELNSTLCSEDINKDACKLYSSCKNCSINALTFTINLLSRTIPEDKNKGFYYNLTYHMADDTTKNSHYYEYEKIDQNQLSNNSKNHILVKRDAIACGHPTSMKTADVACHTTPAVVKCTQFCVFGHTLNDGVTKKLTCHTRENKWKPSGFSECKPFIDCTMRLVSPGSLDCYTATTKQAPICYVKCEKFEDKPEVHRRAYECQPDGSWSKTLPYCAKPGTGIALAPRPHNLGSYPLVE